MVIVNSEMIHSSKLCGHARYILLQVPLSTFENIYEDIENVCFKEKPDTAESEKLFSCLSLMLKTIDDKAPENKLKFISLLYDFFLYNACLIQKRTEEISRNVILRNQQDFSGNCLC